MGRTTGMSKEGKKLFNSNTPDLISKLSPEDRAILEKNTANDHMKLVREVLSIREVLRNADTNKK